MHTVKKTLFENKFALLPTLVGLSFVFGLFSLSAHAESHTQNSQKGGAIAIFGENINILNKTSSSSSDRIGKFPPGTTTAPTRAPILSDDEQVSFDVFQSRRVDHFSLLKIFPYFVQSAAHNGVPTETVALILLLPFIASLVGFVRTIIGLPSLDMLVVITFSIALLAVDIPVGMLLLGTIVVASFLARMLMRKIRIMQLPKVALSMVVVSLGVFAVLYAVSVGGLLRVQEISIVPILLMVLLSERIVRLQFESEIKQTSIIIITTLALGTIGYVLFSSQFVRSAILVFPEIILLLIPINIAIGRYFGLRLTEYFRFSSLTKSLYGDK